MINNVVAFNGTSFLTQPTRGKVEWATIVWPIKAIDPWDVATIVVKKLLTDGGFTYSIGNGFVTNGWAVSLKGHEYKYLNPVYAIDNVGVVSKYLHDKAKVLVNTEGSCIGGWAHEGYVYLDVSVVVKDKEAAIKLGKENEQLAIYDLNKKEEIRIQ